MIRGSIPPKPRLLELAESKRGHDDKAIREMDVSSISINTAGFSMFQMTFGSTTSTPGANVAIRAKCRTLNVKMCVMP